MAKHEKKKFHFYASNSIFVRGIPPFFILLGTGVSILTILSLFKVNIPAAGTWILECLLGLFSFSAYLVGPLLIVLGLLFKRDFEKKRCHRRFLYYLLFLIQLESVLFSILFWNTSFSALDFFQNGINHTGAGLLGSILGYGLFKISLFFGAPILFLFLIFLYLFDFYRINILKILFRRKKRTKKEKKIENLEKEDKSSESIESIEEDSDPNLNESKESKMSIFDNIRKKKEEKKLKKEEQEKAKLQKEMEDNGYFPPANDIDDFDSIRKKMNETSREMDKAMQTTQKTTASVSSILEEVNRQRELEAAESLTVLEPNEVEDVKNPSSNNKAESVFSNFNPFENDVINARENTVLMPGEQKEESPYKNKIGSIRFQGTIGSSALRTTPQNKPSIQQLEQNKEMDYEDKVLPNEETLRTPEIPYVHPATQPSTQLYSNSTQASPNYTYKPEPASIPTPIVEEDSFEEDFVEVEETPVVEQTRFVPQEPQQVQPRFVQPTPKPVQAPQQAPSQAPVGKRQAPDYSHYEYPSFSLLKHAPPIIDGNNEAEIQNICQDMIQAFADFKIQISVNDIVVGPRIIRYSIALPAGTRINAVTNLTNDVALRLSSKSVRIEQIPDTPYLGVEIPNRHPKTVLLSSLIETPDFKNNKSITKVPLGASVTGSPIFADIAKMPHVLVAGATGMGKSVLINAILVSLLYKARPDEVKLILVDPKQVEFAVYAGIPHLLIPPVIEPQKAAGALLWAVGEMNRRYGLMTKYGVRSIDAYNEHVKRDPTLGEFQPKIIIVIDELNDLMLQARDAVEPAIMSIAQKARAAGIHLIIGTQRPSVDVITGVIKANIPSRIALHVTSQTDSRTILDVGGAEKLLNNGDALAMISGMEPVRVQSAFVSDDEVELVTQFLKDHAGPAVYDDIISAQIDSETEKYKNEKNRGRNTSSDEEESDDSDASIFEDSKFMLAVDVAFEAGKVSTSYLQRRIGVGYGKAAKYIDIMERMGIVSPPDGSKPRDILITKDQFMEMVERNSHFDEG